MLTFGSPTRCGCLVLIPLLALIGLAGCESAPRTKPSTITGSTLERLDRFAIDREALTDLGVRVDWRSTLPVGSNTRLVHIDAYSDIVVTQTADTLLSVINADTGAIQNVNELSNRVTTLVGNTRLGDAIVSSTNNDVFFIEPTSGELLDRQSYDAVISAKPVAFQSVLLATTIEGIVFAHTTSLGGYPLWRFGTRDPIDTSVTLSGNSLIAVTRSGRVVALDATSGVLLGENSIFSGPRENTPVASDTTVYIASPDQSIYAFDGSNATLLWRVRTARPLIRQPTLIGTTLYVPTDDQGLLALDAATGQRLWNAPDVLGEVLTEHNGRLLAWHNGRVWSLDASDGSLRAAHDLPGITELVADSVTNGAIYAVSDANVVAKLVQR
jgi:outer membrane protein assembly factor BamB